MKEITFRIPTLYTLENPIRPVAFTHHYVWVEQVNKNLQESFECAIYYEPYTNFVHPYTLDAIFVEILASPEGYHISGFAVFPDLERREIKISEYHTDYPKAKQVAMKWLEAVRKLIIPH
ncbi:hypothetical protein [Sporomusa malonica]|uniref:Uncharacterized protein n=1 Tax=Sporomusa malonica TaxID=112901 RepID=A0A1W2BU45_9FIRM|nr:hypothetical protein [Sporomusa malonica]SMC76254.1 hypothetical protein SAMN04488500_108151 [Sporomusa malonica]